MEVFGIMGTIMIDIVATVVGTGIVALILLHFICGSNEMGEKTGEFQDFVPGDIEIKKEKEYTMNV